MPIALLARLSRSLPLVIVLAVIAVVAYFVLQFLYSPTRAKSILVRVFLWLTGILSIALALICLYAVFDGNMAVLELFATFLGASVVALVVTLVCRAVLFRHHPEYRKRAQRTTGTARFPWLPGSRNK